MADEKKPSKGEKRYSKPAKIAPKGDASETQQGNKAKAESTAAEPKPQDTGTTGQAPKPDVMAGTDGIAINDRNAAERAEMYARHEKETHQMLGRQEKDHKSMRDRHHAELSKMSASGGGAAEK